MDNNQIFEEVDEFKVAHSFECFPSDCAAIIRNSRAYLKVITQNIRSIYKNLDSLTVLQSTLNFECDILILTESRLSEDKLLPQLPSYNVHSTTKHINQNDGVVVYCKSNISYSIDEPAFLDANCLVIKIPPHTAIIAIYRPPCFRTISRFLDSLETVLGSLSSKTNIVIMGDINIDIKNGNNDTMSTDYLNLTAEHGLLPANNFPTRYGNCLDHVLLKTKSQALSFVLQNALTDHFPVLLCLSYKAPCANSRKAVFKSIDYKNITVLLKESNISNILLMNDTNEAADSLINILMNSIQLSTTLRPIPSSQRVSKPWITQGLLRCIRHRDNMHLKVKKQPNDQILVKSYRRYRHFCNGLLKKLKISYERSELEKASRSTKQTWKIFCITKHGCEGG
ncbi:putative tick transposon [Operophtera brumata]|uniref:Putative tick transposon n=1 Tax=Operophtera brumata TaxID=104452 RepID=A0A0L7KQA2_OPEBR|nr:putative tick transposon [Operophtera brumata]